MLINVFLFVILLCLDVSSVLASSTPYTSSLSASSNKKPKKKGVNKKRVGKKAKPTKSLLGAPRSSFIHSDTRYKNILKAQSSGISLFDPPTRLLLSLENFQKGLPAAQELYASPGGKLMMVEDFLKLHTKQDKRTKKELEELQLSYEFLASLDCAVSPFAGVVQSILVKPKDKVKLGAPLAVIELMKMEVTIKALKDNVFIDTLECAKGDTVLKHTVILTYKADDSA